MHIDTGHNFPSDRVFATGASPSSASGCWSRTCKTRSTPGAWWSRSARARHVTSCRRRRCSTRSSSTASTPRWAVRAATRSAHARRSASSAPRRIRAVEPARAAPELWNLTTAYPKGEQIRVFPSPTGPSWTSGSTSRASSSSSRRSTSPTSARSSVATACSTPSPSTSSGSPTKSRSRRTVAVPNGRRHDLHRRGRVVALSIDECGLGDRRDSASPNARDPRRRPRLGCRNGGPQAWRLFLACLRGWATCHERHRKRR